MFFFAGDVQFAVYSLEPFDGTCDDLGGLLGLLEVIHVPCDCHLEDADVLVGNTGVIGVVSEAF